MKETIRFRVGKLVNRSLYFSCDEYCGLFKMDIDKQKVTFLSFFPEEGVLQRFLHAGVLSFGEDLFFIPGGGGKNIHIFNYITGRMKCVPCFTERGWEGEAFISEGYLWMIPAAPGFWPLVRVDLNTLTVEKSEDFFGEFMNIQTGDEKERLLKRVVLEGDSVWFAIVHSNEVVRISFYDHKINRYQVGVKDLFGVFTAGNAMWLTSYTDEYIYKWNPESGICEKCKVQGAKKNAMPSNHIFGISGDIYAIPYLSEYITKYNDRTNYFEKLIEYPDGFCFFNSDHPKFWNYDYDQNIMVCLPVNAEDILFINIQDNTTFACRPENDRDIMREPYLSIGKEIFRDEFVIESRTVILKDYIQYIEMEKNKRKLLLKRDISEKIYELLLR